jgi:hypothetical protein
MKLQRAQHWSGDRGDICQPSSSGALKASASPAACLTKTAHTPPNQRYSSGHTGEGWSPHQSNAICSTASDGCATREAREACRTRQQLRISPSCIRLDNASLCMCD